MSTAPESNSKDPNIGVKVVHRPQHATVDIVAVHGLKGDAYKTWTTKTKKKGERDQEVFWLRDLLPREVPTARVLSYGYDSEPGKVFDSASTNMVHHHAKTLVTELHAARRREDEKERPIIFVCHSLGGIVVKQALNYSNLCNFSNNYEYRSIKVSTYGIIFLGTPHMGADLARWGQMAEQLIRMVTTKAWVDSNDALIKALGRNSETLQAVTESFRSISSDFKMFFFWEELDTPMGVTRTKIVDYSSAVPEALPNVGSSGIHANHSEMCKFVDENSPGWSVLAYRLIQFSKDAPNAIERNWKYDRSQYAMDADRIVRQHMIDYQNNVGRGSPSPVLVDGYTKPPYVELRQPPLILQDGTTEVVEITENEQDNQQPRKAIEYVIPPLVKPESLKQNGYFVGRDEELKKMHRYLREHAVRNVSISAVPGGGKTHLAREYFFRHKDEYTSGAFWIDCKTINRTTSAHKLDYWYAQIAEKLELLPCKEEESNQKPEDLSTFCRMRVIEWFERTENWLLVLDGLDVEEEDKLLDKISEYIPGGKGGSIIITTLNASFAGATRLGSPHGLELDRVQYSDAVDMLFHYSHIEKPTEKDKKTAQDLVIALGYLPMAIQSAGSYIKQRRITVAEYLKKYRQRPLVQRDFLEAFHILIDQIQEWYAEAHNLLRILAFFDHEISVAMLLWGIHSRSLPYEVKLMRKENDRYDFDDTIKHLVSYSLVDRTRTLLEDGQSEDNRVEIDTIMLHTVAQDVSILRMHEKKELKEWLGYAIKVFCGSFESVDSRRKEGEFFISDYRRYEVHGERLKQHAKKYKVSTKELEATLVKVREAVSANGVIDRDRRSMFRSDSLTDQSSTSGQESTTSHSPISTRTPTWTSVPSEYWTESPITHGPEDGNFLDRQPRQPPSRQEPGHVAELEAQNELKEEIQKHHDQHPVIPRRPPRGPRNPHNPRNPWAARRLAEIQRSSTFHDRLGPNSRAYPTNYVDINTGSPYSAGTGFAGAGFSSLRDIQQRASHLPHRQTTPIPGFQEAPTFNNPQFSNPPAWVNSPATMSPQVSGSHYNPLGPSMTPVNAVPPRMQPSRPPLSGRRRSGSLPHPNMGYPHAQSAPEYYGRPLNSWNSSPTLSSAYGQSPQPYFSPTYNGSLAPVPYPQPGFAQNPLQMPPYPVTPSNDRPNFFAPQERPRPFSPGFVAPRDWSKSPAARGIVGPRDRPPSVMSEPILEDSDFFSPQISNVGGSPMHRNLSSQSRSGSSTTGSRPGSRSVSPMMFQLEAAAHRASSASSQHTASFPTVPGGSYVDSTGYGPYNPPTVPPPVQQYNSPLQYQQLNPYQSPPRPNVQFNPQAEPFYHTPNIPELPASSPPAPAPGLNINDGLGISVPVPSSQVPSVNFQPHTPTHQGPPAHTRHISLGDAPTVIGPNMFNLRLPSGEPSPLRRSSVPEVPQGEEAESMQRSKSEGATTSTGGPVGGWREKEKAE